MRTSPRIAVAVLLSILLVVSAVRMFGARNHYLGMNEDLSRSTAQLDQIKSLRKKPDRAARQSRSTRSLAKAIEQSATQSGLKTSQVASIEPQALRRVRDTAYEEHATVVRVEAVTLPELARLAAAIKATSSDGQALQISVLRISAPYQKLKGSQEVWNVELTLTYLVYSPKNVTT